MLFACADFLYLYGLKFNGIINVSYWLQVAGYPVLITGNVQLK
jgi:hypothetical protein